MGLGLVAIVFGTTNAILLACCVLLFYRVRKIENALNQLMTTLITAARRKSNLPKS